MLSVNLDDDPGRGNGHASGCDSRTGDPGLPGIVAVRETRGLRREGRQIGPGWGLMTSTSLTDVAGGVERGGFHVR